MTLIPAPVLKWWLVGVASFRGLAVVLGYFFIDKVKSSVFSLAPSQVSDLQGRTFAQWTLATCTVTLFCAFNLSSKPLFVATWLTFFAAVSFFFAELFVYGSVTWRNLVGPLVFGGGSLVLMGIFYVENFLPPGDKNDPAASHAVKAGVSHAAKAR
uniref:Ergosterol biosynthetic protein 28 n=1 Tax=Chromera velia CCMP2878 TaxID=1169474 RepID=A0A0G4I7D9_9ALVE|mmetsp:Transcript_28822/g.56474  ORF Transcript_28822/g.56474 Transcript_28822/m.56474 type:complete len:156 (-) Transcript_28822:374-841(-)|eukprot:Cvel_16435.t1-p1 / transcript=Cvel_16435.t1 / gene=Cvel_16435 / organism=Chromera_velia_CCMP2878 / gene_product=Ergosterol biosynthetic protein 28, putative / transcript_product=Ergosterol biosynthetic protein 28, putative / location=Cvel_scaffold1266:50004-50468(+) / protein_length=155 / sequence_SO=supercontig / SO=protein_coding / is_pseudo=false